MKKRILGQAKSMSKTKFVQHRGWMRAVALLMVPAICPTALPAQQMSPNYWPADSRNSQAERQAELMVSLSAEKLISLLQHETGLLLEVKKRLVRAAFDQGRILEPKDLTDDALFRLLREDENVRVLATQEAVSRSYIRALPTHGERERESALMARNSAQYGSRLNGQRLPGQDQAPPTGNEEDLYWAQQQRKADAQRPQEQQQQTPEIDQMPSLPEMTPVPPAPGLKSMQPEELPELLRTSAPQQTGLGSLAATGADASATNPTANMASLPPGAGFPQTPTDFFSQDNEPPAQANQDSSLPSQPRPLPSRQRVDRIALQRRVNPYADVPSLFDLYEQYGARPPQLVRFGDDIFRNGTGNFDKLPMDLPVGPDYVLGPGDGVNIDMWGGVSQRLRRTVDSEGRLSLPEAGFVQVAGKTLGDVQRLVQTALQTQFRYAQADVSLSRLRTVRVYVVGDVERAGAYDVSSLSTPLNAVFAAGGPTSRGSLRTLRHYRGNSLVQEVDVYDLLLHGVRSGVERMQPGDTVLVPPLGPEVTVEGMVRRPAIYELNGEKNLAAVLQLAGGVLSSGTLRHVDVERVEAHESRTMLRLDMPENNNQADVTKALEDFPIQDGDKIKISPILPYAEKTVYLDGHVFRPGKYAYRDGMTLTDLVKSYNDVLPEPSRTHAEIVRLNPPDFSPQVIAFNLGDALSGKMEPIVLKPFDTVRIFSRFDFEDSPVITISGEVREPGDHLTNGVTHVRDAIYLAGGLTSDASTDSVQIFRKTNGNRLEVLSANLKEALAGDAKNNLLLEAQDRLVIHRDLNKVDPPTVMIEGEVARPGRYPLGQDMTAAQLVRVAGGFTRAAYTDSADLTRYTLERESGQSEKGIVGEHSNIAIAEAMTGEPDSDMRLRDGDVLTIRQLSGWKDVGASIKVDGEVVHPGTYGIQEGERLSSVLARAGGLRSDAYPYGAIFERAQVRELAEKNRVDLLQRTEQEGAGLRAAPETDPETKGAKYAAMMQWQTAVEHLENTPATGRMVIHISKDTRRWQNTTSDIVLRAGDSIYIPKVPTSIMVDGSVYNSTAVTYKPGKNTAWYLKQSGGPTNMANKKAIFVIRADGSVVAGGGGLISGGVESAELRPGDMVVVPEKALSANSKWKTALETSQLVYAAGIAIQVARSF